MYTKIKLPTSTLDDKVAEIQKTVDQMKEDENYQKYIYYNKFNIDWIGSCSIVIAIASIVCLLISLFSLARYEDSILQANEENVSVAYIWIFAVAAIVLFIIFCLHRLLEAVIINKYRLYKDKLQLFIEEHGLYTLMYESRIENIYKYDYIVSKEFIDYNIRSDYYSIEDLRDIYNNDNIQYDIDYDSSECKLNIKVYKNDVEIYNASFNCSASEYCIVTKDNSILDLTCLF